MRYRAALRGFDLAAVDGIVRYSAERYLDQITGSHIVVGSHADTQVMIAYQAEKDVITPITIHATTRAQIKARLKSGRFTHE